MSNPATPSPAFEVDWDEICRAAGPYPRDAFDFVRQGLAHTVSTCRPDGPEAPNGGRHVSGQQLCMGLRDFAILKYGLMAPAVLAHWNIARTDDFGRIVFAMIDAGMMSKTPQDSIDDFRAVYDFAEVFSHQQVASRLRNAGTVRATA
ncbi:MAG: hypothetical protein KF724_06045 [Phycisphaeraceae bacterium]|nr:hypothetical protein [Phycisphaeraceae bacterium]